mgnify:CR=1 FL=1
MKMFNIKYQLINLAMSIVGVLVGKHLGLTDSWELIFCGVFALFNFRGGLALWKKLRGEGYAL